MRVKRERGGRKGGWKGESGGNRKKWGSALEISLMGSASASS